ncbi:hypothetical protein [Luteolibacter sp. Populi]|uniref:hypothetical protein n=1 Tax=Luteolibacter sp. Populi TaxID=3230487 RepID=UPI003467DD8A
MIFTSDRAFDEALASAEALESYLADLEKQRRMNRGLYLFSMVVFLAGILGLLLSSYKHPGNLSGVSIGVAILMGFASLSQLASALSAQADIRTLKAHKKAMESHGARENHP